MIDYQSEIILAPFQKLESTKKYAHSIAYPILILIYFLKSAIATPYQTVDQSEQIFRSMSKFLLAIALAAYSGSLIALYCSQSLTRYQILSRVNGIFISVMFFE